jgi:hypothetical protein
MRTIRLAIAWAALSGFLPTIALAQEALRPAELQRLSFYVGSWSEAGQMRDDPAKPFKSIAGGETCSWAAGGYAVLCQERTSGQGGGWEGVYILSYDSTAKRYHVHSTENPGSNLHAVGQIEGNRWIWVTDPAPDGSRLRYTFAPSLHGARTLMVEAGTGDSWAPIANIKYAVRK